MLTGKRAFAGDEVSDVLASVLAREPDWTLLPHGLSPIIGTFLKRCLHKDRKQRIGDAQSFRLALEGAFDTHETTPSSGAQTPRRWRERVAWAGVIVLLIALVSTLAMMYVRTQTASKVSRLQITPTGTAALSLSAFDQDLAITPDGSRVVYVGNNGTQLFVRALDALEPVALARGELRAPFISLDGQWVGYIDNGQTIRKIALNGGPPVNVLRSFSGGFRGATWTADDSVVFGSLEGGL